MQITCDKFLLRLYKPHDKYAFQRHINNKKICRALSRVPYPYTLDHAEEFVSTSIAEYKNVEFPYSFTIDIGGHTVGAIGLNEISHRQGEIGYWLAEEHWNKGIMTNAMHYFTDYCFDTMGLERLYAMVYCSNTPSIKVLEKCGYIREETICHTGGHFDSFIYTSVH